MGLFSDIYNTVAKFFRPQEEQGDASKSVATNRLKLVLMQDRTNLTPKVLEQMRGELIDLLSRYVELDKELLELKFEQEGEQVALMLSIPVIRAKDEDEIEAAGVNLKDETGEETKSEEDLAEDAEENSEPACEDSSEENAEEQSEENAEESSEPTCEESSEKEVGQNLKPTAQEPTEEDTKVVSAPKGINSNKPTEEVKKECHTEN